MSFQNTARWKISISFFQRVYSNQFAYQEFSFDWSKHFFYQNDLTFFFIYISITFKDLNQPIWQVSLYSENWVLSSGNILRLWYSFLCGSLCFVSLEPAETIDQLPYKRFWCTCLSNGVWQISTLVGFTRAGIH